MAVIKSLNYYVHFTCCLYVHITQVSLAKSCDVTQLTFFKSLKYCRDREIGIGANCSCGSESCTLSTMRSFLPSPELLTKSLQDKYCDSMFSRLADVYIERKATFTPHIGYPQSVDSVHCHIAGTCVHASPGKSVRYNALIEYFRFNHRSFTGKSSLFDIIYPHRNGWYWTQNINMCNDSRQPATYSWSCAFLNMSSSLHENGNINYAGSVDDAKIQDMIHLRENKTDHVLQIMVYGKLLSRLTRPSKLVQQYMEQNVVDVMGNKNAVRPEHFTDTAPPSVSMHVRQGDSCDFVLHHEIAHMTTYINTTGGHRRPCFSVDVYMKKLSLLRTLYAVNKVYLATDSEEMIHRTHLHTEYNWIYINISRSHFSQGWVDRSAASRERSQVTLFSAVADMALLSRGDIFLGAFSGHLSKVFYYLMAGQQMRLPPFVSLDYPLSCDTIDICSDVDVLARKQTIEGIISRAPECQRKRSGRVDGWVQPWSDPCGLY